MKLRLPGPYTAPEYITPDCSGNPAECTLYHLPSSIRVRMAITTGTVIPGVPAAILKMSPAALWQCVAWTAAENTAIPSSSEGVVCHTVAGRIFTNRNNRYYPGCGTCSCCVPTRPTTPLAGWDCGSATASSTDWTLATTCGFAGSNLVANSPTAYLALVSGLVYSLQQPSIVAPVPAVRDLSWTPRR